MNHTPSRTFTHPFTHLFGVNPSRANPQNTKPQVRTFTHTLHGPFTTFTQQTFTFPTVPLRGQGDVGPERTEQHMARNRASAKKAGSSFERLVADYLATHVDDRIDRRIKMGAADRGDISGLRMHGQRIAIECKNTARTNLGPWIAEAHTAAGNDSAAVGIVCHKRHGRGAAEDQWVTMTLADLVFLLTGEPQERRYEP